MLLGCLIKTLRYILSACLTETSMRTIAPDSISNVTLPLKRYSQNVLIAIRASLCDLMTSLTHAQKVEGKSVEKRRGHYHCLLRIH